MGILIGLVVTLGCVLGGFMAMGGHIEVLIQPWEVVIICGAALGSFLVANPMKVVKDTGKACMEAFKQAVPKEQDYLEVLGVLHSLMRELKSKSRSEVEAHIDNPDESTIFQAFPTVLKNHDLTHFICDYRRIIIIGNARPHEIEALMDEEIQTIRADKLKAYHALTTVSDGFPAIGIVAAVLGVVKAMGALDQSPEILGGLIRRGAGRHLPRHLHVLLRGRAHRRQDQGAVREKKNRLYIIVKVTLLAYMNGSLPQVAIEFGPQDDLGLRAAVDRRAVEQSTMNSGAAAAKKAAA